MENLKVTAFVDPVDNFYVFVKFEKIGGDYVILNTEEWFELEAKKRDISDCFNHLAKLGAEMELYNGEFHAVFMKNLCIWTEKCIY